MANSRRLDIRYIVHVHQILHIVTEAGGQRFGIVSKAFRRLPGVEEGFSPSLTYAIRLARREIALTVREQLGEKVQTFDLAATLKSDIEKLGQQIREYLDVTEAQQQRFARKAFDGWRLPIEAKDVLGFVVPHLKIREMRSTALAEQTMPVIIINGKDLGNGRVFTLLHEFCHLALRQSGVSDMGGDRNDAPRSRSSATQSRRRR